MPCTHDDWSGAPRAPRHRQKDPLASLLKAHIDRAQTIVQVSGTRVLWLDLVSGVPTHPVALLNLQERYPGLLQLRDFFARYVAQRFARK